MTAAILRALPIKFTRTSDEPPDPLDDLRHRISRLEVAVWALLAANAPDAVQALAAMFGAAP